MIGQPECVYKHAQRCMYSDSHIAIFFLSFILNNYVETTLLHCKYIYIYNHVYYYTRKHSAMLNYADTFYTLQVDASSPPRLGHSYYTATFSLHYTFLAQSTPLYVSSGYLC